MSIKIVLVDDHQMMREGLRSMLEKDPEMQVVAEAENGRTALERVRLLAPDVVVMDIGMAELNGIDATRQILAMDGGVKVIALSTYCDKRYVMRMLNAGAVGYVVKAAASEELVRAIRAATQGKHYLSSDITGVVIEEKMRQPPSTAKVAELSSREREVLQLLAEGNTSRQITAQLHISIKTVEAHRHNLMKKLDLHNIAELTKFAVREGITSLEE